MEIIKKIFLIFFLLIVFVYVTLSIYIHYNGKDLIEERLSAALQKEVHVGKARILFPLGLRFDNVQIQDVLTAKVLRIHLGLPIFFGGHFNIAKLKLTEPVFFITYTTTRKILWGNIVEGDPLTATAPSIVPQESLPALKDSPSPPVKIKVSQGIIIDYLEVKNGKLKIMDQVHKNLIDVGQINLKAMEITLPPRNMKTKFDFAAFIMSENAPFAGQKVEARGMVNVIARNMDATIKMIDPSGTAGLSAHFKSVNNDMIVKGKINVGRFVSGIKTKDSKESSLEGFLANALESSGMEIGVNFSCQTKMDDFNCDKIGMSGNVIQNQRKP